MGNRLIGGSITRLLDYPITRLPDYPITRLSKSPIIVFTIDGPDAAVGPRRDRTDPAAPLSVPARRPDHRARSRQADRRHQERLAERAVLVARAERIGSAAADDPHGSHRAGRRDSDS